MKRLALRVVGRPFADVPYTLQRIMEYLRPLVEERNDNLERFGKGYAGQPVRVSTSSFEWRLILFFRKICFRGSWTRSMAVQPRRN